MSMQLFDAADRCIRHLTALSPHQDRCMFDFYPEISGQMDKVINSRFANIPVYFFHRHVWGASIPSTPDFSQLSPTRDCSTLHLA